MKTTNKTQCPFAKLLKMNPVGRLLAFQKDPYGFFDEYKPENTAKPVALNLGFRRFFFCYDPQHAKHILQDQKHKYDKSSLVLKKIKGLSGPQGLIQLKGENALRVRQTSAKLMNPGWREFKYLFTGHVVFNFKRTLLWKTCSNPIDGKLSNGFNL